MNDAPGTKFTAIYFFRSLGMCLISQSVCPWQPISAVRNMTLTYLAHPQVVSKLMCCEKAPWIKIHDNVFSL